jgi:hypothetical protein
MNRPSDAELLAALRTLALVVSPAPTAPTEFISAAESPAGQRAVREAVRRGELEGFRPGKALLVRRAQHAAWIESHRVEPKAAPKVGSLIDRLGTRRETEGSTH